MNMIDKAGVCIHVTQFPVYKLYLRISCTFMYLHGRRVEAVLIRLPIYNTIAIYKQARASFKILAKKINEKCNLRDKFVQSCSILIERRRT